MHLIFKIKEYLDGTLDVVRPKNVYVDVDPCANQAHPNNSSILDMIAKFTNTIWGFIKKLFGF